jgi:hypothetical protein
MSNNWRTLFFNNSLCEGSLQQNQQGNVDVKGKLIVNDISLNAKITYWAANPAETHYSFSGSNLPFSSPEVAFENTVNIGSSNVVNGEFNFSIIYPNSYYAGLGTMYVPPSVNIKICDTNYENNIETIVLGPGVPFRTLVHPAPPSKNNRISPNFYKNESIENIDVRTQEQILLDSAYPIYDVVPPEIPDNFWGLRPPR